MKLSEIYIRDPYIFVENDVVYLLGTTDKQAWSGKADSFLVYKSKDLINFDGPYLLFENEDSFWADENFWAPELHKIDEKYCMFASFYKKGYHRASQVLITDSILGKYIPISKPFTPIDKDCLDATFYKENGKRYTVFCHEWVQIHDGEFVLGELNNDFTDLKNVKVLFKASQIKWAVPCPEGNLKTDFVSDGPFLFKGKNYLYLLFSSFSKDGYSIGYAKSEEGILGNWHIEDKPLLSNGCGHGMIFTFKGKNYLVCHNNNNNHLLERALILEIFENENGLFLKQGE